MVNQLLIPSLFYAMEKGRDIMAIRDIHEKYYKLFSDFVGANGA